MIKLIWSMAGRFRMFEPNMDEYLDEEVEWVKQCFELTSRGWDKQAGHCRIPMSSSTLTMTYSFLSELQCQILLLIMLDFSVLIIPLK